MKYTLSDWFDPFLGSLKKKNLSPRELEGYRSVAEQLLLYMHQRHLTSWEQLVWGPFLEQCEAPFAVEPEEVLESLIAFLRRGGVAAPDLPQQNVISAGAGAPDPLAGWVAATPASASQPTPPSATPAGGGWVAAPAQPSAEEEWVAAPAQPSEGIQPMPTLGGGPGVSSPSGAPESFSGPGASFSASSPLLSSEGSRLEDFQSQDRAARNTLRFLLVGLLLLLFGGGYLLFSYISFLGQRASFARVLRQEVLSTDHYGRVNAQRARQFVKKEARKLNLPLSKMEIYITLQKKKDFQERAHDYYLSPTLQGYRNVLQESAEYAPGCTMVDSLHPDENIRSLTRPGEGAARQRGSFIKQKLRAASRNDARGVLGSGRRRRKLPPQPKIIFAVDVLVPLRMGLFRRKLWFHRRCYFYSRRRPYQPAEGFTALNNASP